MKSQVVNILGFVGYTTSVATTALSCAEKQPKTRYKQGAWLCSSQTEFIKIGQAWPTGPALSTPSLDYNEILALSIAFMIFFPVCQRRWKSGTRQVPVALLSVSCLGYLGFPTGIPGPAHTHVQQEQLRMQELRLLPATSGQNQHPPAGRHHGGPHNG